MLPRAAFADPLPAVTGAVLTFFGSGLAVAQPVDAGRIANITKAAAEIGALQEKRGADGAFAAIKQCYDRELPSAKSLTRGLETCMAQDILVSQLSAAIFGRVSAEARKRAGALDPDTVLKSMTDRVVSVYRKFGVPQDEGRKFNGLVQAHGVEAYQKALRPQAAQQR